MADIFNPCDDPSTWPAVQEPSGSPTEQYNKEGWSGQRVFLVRPNYVQTLINVLQGVNLGAGSSSGAQFPGRPGCYVDDILVERNEDAKTTFQNIDNIETDINEYPDSLTRITAQYKFLNSAEGDVPVSEGYVDYSFSSNKEALYLPGRQMVWENEPEQIIREADAALPFYQTVIEHTFTWYNVTKPPFTAIRELAGTVNSVPWPPQGQKFQAPRGTLLFDNASGSVRTYTNPEPNVAQPGWTITYVFKEKQIFDGGNFKGGWNYVYREAPADKVGWQQVQFNNGDLPYRETDFDPLFNAEPAAQA